MRRTPSALLLMLALATAPAAARGQSAPAVSDRAGMFSADAVRAANAEAARAGRARGMSVTVEAVEGLDGQSLDEFATRRAEQVNKPGIFVLIARKEHKVQVLAAPRAFREELGLPRLNAIRDAFTEPFRENHLDDGLLKGVEAAAAALASVRPEPKPRESMPAAITPAAGPSDLVLKGQVRLTLAGARLAISGAEAMAREKGHKMNIAAVNDGGHLLAFARMDGARPASAATATTKAVTAATYRQATGPLGGPNPDVLLNLSLQNAAAASGGKVTTLLGGVPIVVDGQVIGALGVGGGTGEQDAEVAKAGVAAFLAGLSGPARAGDPDDEEINRKIRGEASPK